jgi:hypothetical protein
MLSSSDIVALAATRAGVGRRDESGWREEDDAVMVMAAVAMLSRRGRAVDDTIRGGDADDARCRCHDGGR